MHELPVDGSEVSCDEAVAFEQAEELIKKPGGAMIDEPDEVVDVVKMKSAGTTRGTCRMIDNITCFYPES